MLLLNTLLQITSTTFTFISIHLMLLLNVKSINTQVKHMQISIHLMLLLNATVYKIAMALDTFQYILCCY